MRTFKGTIRKNDLEGGFWELVTDDGEHYQLDGGDAKLLVEGQKVQIEGRVSSSTMGIGMGSQLDVSSWTKL
jgi:hypothetical protein